MSQSWGWTLPSKGRMLYPGGVSHKAGDLCTQSGGFVYTKWGICGLYPGGNTLILLGVRDWALQNGNGCPLQSICPSPTLRCALHNTRQIHYDIVAAFDFSR